MKGLLLKLMVVSALAGGFTSCATNDSPPVRRVSAAEFMKPHKAKGLATDQFIGVSYKDPARKRNPDKAFKTIWQMGLFHGWAIIWCPADELPKDYLKNAHVTPNR